MITFREHLIGEDSLPSFLFEGGNVKIKNKTAEDIDLTVHNRDSISEVIMGNIVEFNKAFKDELGLYIWKPSVLKAGKVFSGSTKHFFDDKISTEDFVEMKKSVGDIDLMVDENLKIRITKFVENNEDYDFGSMTLVGNKKSGDQLITLWEMKEPKLNLQIDLEFVKYSEDKPAKWSEFSHSSALEDLKAGIKGVFHKLLMSSLLGPKKTDVILQMKTKQKEIKAGSHTLTVKGLRKKHEKIGMQDGKPLVKETHSKEFNTNFYDILKAAFDLDDPTDEDIDNFWSFIGIVKLIKANMKKNVRQKVFEDFIDKLFGPSAQSLYRDDPNKDLDEKMIAVNYLIDKLNVSTNDLSFEQMKKDFYKKK